MCLLRRMTTPRKATIRAYVDAFNRGDFNALLPLFTDDAEIQGVLGWGGLDVALPVWRDLHQSLAMELVPETMIEEGDLVAVRYFERGCSVAPFRAFPATGRSYEIVAMELFEFHGDRIRRRWGARDSAAIARQLGWS
jgi:predicted ester cyclase